MLIEYQITPDGVKKINKVDMAIKRLKSFEPDDGYALAFSGGKDSVVIKRLAEMAGVKYDPRYSITTVDPPELVKFVRSQNVQTVKAKYNDGKQITMWNLIVREKMPPTRFARYCCAKLKENSTCGKLTITGVRWAESGRRKKYMGVARVFGKQKKDGVIYNMDNDDARRMVEQCYRTRTTIINPIIDWSDDDVWEFIRSEHIPYCGLYDDGFKRIGCIGCPMTVHQEYTLKRWPKYMDAYIRTFDKMIMARTECGLKNDKWKTGTDVMDWWLGKTKPINESQLLLW